MEKLLPELLRVAIEAARLPSSLILSGFRSDRLSAERKSDGSPVTNYDREAERMIRAYLAEHQPGEWPVLGEEFGLGEGFGVGKGFGLSKEFGLGEARAAGGASQGPAAARYRWVVDPIDGTLPFTRGLPTFGTLLAFEDVTTGRALVGVIHLPAMNETYSAARGLGSWCDGKRMQVAGARELRDCIISVPAEHHFRLAGIADTHEQLRAQAPHLRVFADCWAHAMVARGSIDALAEFRLCRWDIAATEVIVEEAGGVVMTRDAPHAPGKYDSIMGSPQAAREVAAILRFPS